MSCTAYIKVDYADANDDKYFLWLKSPIEIGSLHHRGIPNTLRHNSRYESLDESSGRNRVLYLTSQNNQI